MHDVGKPKTRKFLADGSVTFHHHDVVGAKLTRKRMQALRFSGELIDAVTTLVELHLRFHGYGSGEWTDSAVRRYVRDAGDQLERLHVLTRADCTTRNARKAERLRRTYDDLEARIERLSAEEELASIRPDLDGDQIMAILDIPSGREVGEAYRFLLELRLDEGPQSPEAAEAALRAWWAETCDSRPSDAAPRGATSVGTTVARWKGSEVGHDGRHEATCSSRPTSRCRARSGSCSRTARCCASRSGGDVLATKGSMIAFQGQVRFDHEKTGGFAKLAKKVLSSEDTSLMRVSGQGEVFFADQAGYVYLLHLENESISINSRNLMAFDATLAWDINRVKGAGMAGGGVFNTTVTGTGTVRGQRRRQAGRARLQPAADVRRRAGRRLLVGEPRAGHQQHHEHEVDAPRRQRRGVPVRLPRPGLRGRPGLRVDRPGRDGQRQRQQRPDRRPLQLAASRRKFCPSTDGQQAGTLPGRGEHEPPGK